MPAKLPDIIALPYMGQANQIMHDLLAQGSISPQTQEAHVHQQVAASNTVIALPDKTAAACRSA